MHKYTFGRHLKSAVWSSLVCTAAGLPLSGRCAPGTAPEELRAAARTFAVMPSVGDATAGWTGAKVLKVAGDLQTTVVLLDDGRSRLCLVTSHLPVERVEIRAAIRQAVFEGGGIKGDEVAIFGSHNHCAVPLGDNLTVDYFREPGAPAAGKLNRLGEEYMAKLWRAAAELPRSLAPVSIEWSVAHEDRFVYNRRGHRPDGTAYFIREEDRLLLGEGYKGVIDPDATLVVLRGRDGRPVAALAHYTGHPVTAYNPERPVIFGEWPQVACEIVSAKIGAPVAFLQGCAGDINSKFILVGTVEQSKEFGRDLAESWLKAYASLKPSARSDISYRRVAAELPYADLPGEESLRRDLAGIDDFIRRARAGDQNTLFCAGLNFPRALSPAYRAELVKLIRPWYVWALDVRSSGRAATLPKALPVELFVGRIGDVGLVGMPFEPFVKIGLRIKREAGLPCVMPCGYCEAGLGYVPDASACDDRDYMGGFFRYTRYHLPYRPPAGEAAAIAAVDALRQL